MLTEEQKRRIKELHEKGLSRNKIARELGISWDTVNRVLKSANFNKSKDLLDKTENFREEFERKSRIFEYEVELKRMGEEITREKELADEYRLYKLEILEKKVDWVIKNIEGCDEEINAENKDGIQRDDWSSLQGDC
jgi:IS30 family transposase